MATTDDHGLSEMREEHRPRRTINRVVCLLTRCNDREYPWKWKPIDGDVWCEIECSETVKLWIDAAQREALRAAGFDVDHFKTGEVAMWCDEKDEHLVDYVNVVYPSLRAAYAAVFPKEAAHGK